MIAAISSARLSEEKIDTENHRANKAATKQVFSKSTASSIPSVLGKVDLLEGREIKSRSC